MEWKFTNTPSDVEFMPFKVVGGEAGAETIAYVTKDGKMFFRGKEIASEDEFNGLVLEFTNTRADTPRHD